MAVHSQQSESSGEPMGDLEGSLPRKGQQLGSQQLLSLASLPCGAVPLEGWLNSGTGNSPSPWAPMELQQVKGGSWWFLLGPPRRGNTRRALGLLDSSWAPQTASPSPPAPLCGNQKLGRLRQAHAAPEPLVSAVCGPYPHSGAQMTQLWLVEGKDMGQRQK